MYKKNLISEFEMLLIERYDSDVVKDISNTLIVALDNYDVSKKEMSLVVYEDENEIILKNYAGCMLVEGKAEKTIKHYITSARKLSDSVGKNLKDINSYDVRGFLAKELQRGLSKRSTENTRSYLSSFFGWMTNEGIIENNPCNAIDKIKYISDIKLPFTDVDIDRLRTVKLSKRDRAIFEVLLSSGMRVAELCNLKKGDIDLDSLKVHIKNGKGGKDRITFISRVASHHLREYLESREDDLKCMFVTHENRGKDYRREIDTSAVRGLLKRMEEESGVVNVHPHRLRRTFATSMYNKSMDLHEIQRLLGHNNISTTLGYIKSDDLNLENSYKKHIIS